MTTKQKLAFITQLLNEEDQVIYQRLNQTTAFYHKEQTIPDAFYHAAHQYADRIALSFEDRTLTYRQLNEQSNQIAHMLVKHGLKKGDYVALIMERSIETVISLLGILKAGGVYIPIDPTYPKERCHYLLNDTCAPFILTKEEHLPLLADYAQPCTTLSFNQVELSLSTADFSSTVQPTDLAYIIYTSGSTGKPKGVMLKHEAVINLITDNQRIYQTTEQDVFSQFISYSFDPSVTETFTALFSGARLHLLTSIERISVEAFADRISLEHITTATVPNAFFTQLATYLPEEYKDKLASLRYIAVGGEALLPAVVQKWHEKFGTTTEIVNVYGPTECTVLSSYYKVDWSITYPQKSIPIGKPIANYEMYVINDNQQLCPVNTAGELYIAGIGLAAGYLHQPEKTSEAFVPHLLKDNQLMYRTGDIVRLLPDGMIEFVGRKDSQIKVRGFRIELGEIEAVLSSHPHIEEVVVLAKKMADGINRLYAYYTGTVEHDIIRTYLGQRLPDYMVPDHFLTLQEMPLAPTGKIDRKYLATLPIDVSSDRTYDAPENEQQQLLANAWSSVLGIERVGIHDNFFHIGGHSLKVLEILALVKKHIPTLKIQDFFQYPTISGLDKYLQQHKSEAVAASPKHMILKELMEPEAFGTPLTVKSLPMRNVLLTGATGYLGSHILYELLLSTDAHIYCLVRSNSSVSIDEKLRTSMQFYFDDDMKSLFSNRLTIVEGDLGQEKLGLSLADEQLLATAIDTIIHCGADVRHFGAAQHFTDVNVEGTRYLLELAKCRQGIHFHYVSTMGIPEELAAHHEEDEDFNYDIQLDNVYTQSKLTAENLVRHAMNEQIPATIYRVGNLSCHSETGKFQRNIDDNAFYRMMKSMLALGKTPSANWHVDFTPIDYASKALVTLANQLPSPGQIFHLCNPIQLPYSELLEIIEELGYNLDIMTATDYTEWLLHGQLSREVQQYLPLAIAQLEGDGASDSPFVFNCRTTQAFLASTDVRCVAPNVSYIHRMLQYGIDIGYFPKPMPIEIL
ncbi:non-ribosomal peptide synthetase family protein [Lysinibacillus piscis]|uniref:Peptide synthetase n=1 Tax=Lysinibacillus piscis TaxID=2518931 RepID=A0ABQ5NPC7_9BACI|nr:non-ribosomal peptide synthetase [Lysinibacillus sp. KH24]GLC90226.1 peptide synthetase [Lysinibacillus sp. KH24]